MNIEALNQGYTLMKEQLNDLQGDFKLQTTEENPHLYMIGNDAIGLGAISLVLVLWSLIQLHRHLKLWNI